MDPLGHRLTLIFPLLLVGVGMSAKEFPKSEVRRYFWPAREAYEKRDFKKAETLFMKYKAVGMPEDALLKPLGCQSKTEAQSFEATLTKTRACLKTKERQKAWTDGEKAKLEIRQVFDRNDPAALIPYLECGALDLTAQSDPCTTRRYPDIPEFTRLIHYLHDRPSIYRKLDWRRSAPEDKRRLPYWMQWTLHSRDSTWSPCGMPGAGIIALREYKDGRFRIASFAASCLEGASE